MSSPAGYLRCARCHILRPQRETVASDVHPGPVCSDTLWCVNVGTKLGPKPNGVHR